MGGQVGLVNSPEKGNEVTWLSVCVDFGAHSKGQQFLKTFYAGCVKGCVWGVIIDFVTLALSHPPLPSETDLPTGTGYLSQFYSVAVLTSAPLCTKQEFGLNFPRGPFYPRFTKLGLGTTEPFNLVLIPHLWSASWILGVRI